MNDKNPLPLEEFWLARLDVLRKNYGMIVDDLEAVEDDMESLLKAIYGSDPVEDTMPRIDKSVSIPQRFEKAVQIARLIGDISKIIPEDDTRSGANERN